MHKQRNTAKILGSGFASIFTFVASAINTAITATISAVISVIMPNHCASCNKTIHSVNQLRDNLTENLPSLPNYGFCNKCFLKLKPIDCQFICQTCGYPNKTTLPNSSNCGGGSAVGDGGVGGVGGNKILIKCLSFARTISPQTKQEKKQQQTHQQSCTQCITPIGNKFNMQFNGTLQNNNITQMRSSFEYTPAIASIIVALKYKDELHNAGLVAKYMADTFLNQMHTRTCGCGTVGDGYDDGGDCCAVGDNGGDKNLHNNLNTNFEGGFNGDFVAGVGGCFGSGANLYSNCGTVGDGGDKNLRTTHYIVCVPPMHKQALSQRKYNQTSIVSQHFCSIIKSRQSLQSRQSCLRAGATHAAGKAKLCVDGGKLAMHFIPDLLIKSKQTVSQASLTKQQRLTNLQDAIHINPNRIAKLNTLISASAKQGNALQILIIDDVITTMATMIECASALNIVCNIACKTPAKPL